MSSSLEALVNPQAAYTPEFTYVRGDFTIGSERVPYFSVAMPVEQAARSLRIPREVVLSPTAPIKMEELFQRDLDANHVEQIQEYLKRPKQPKFFNSITVVLLPMDPTNPRRLADSYEAPPTIPPIPAETPLTVYDVGPVRISHLKNEEKLGFISWNLQYARAVIVDGQHRFQAARELLNDVGKPFAYRQDLAETSLPVLLLVLDKRAGFETAKERPESVLQTCRALFIDLNKHAVRVAPARQYLLDDRDPVAVSMRRILSDEVGGGPENVAERVRQTKQIPLALVDWWSEEAKFDKGPYVTTTISLYSMVQNVLSVTPDTDQHDYAAQREYVDRLIARLDLVSQGDFDEAAIRREIHRAEENDLPFSLSNTAVRWAADGFRASLGALVVRPLTELLPYGQLIDQYEKQGLLSGKYEQWLGLDEAGKRAFEAETGEDPSGPASEIRSEIKDDRFRLAYQVVFQKAFIRAISDMDRFRPVLMQFWGLGSEDRESYITAWIGRFNEIFGSRLNDTGLWEGAGVSTGKTVWSEASQRAIAGFLVYGLVAPLKDWAAMPLGEAKASTRDWLENAWAHAGAGRPVQSIEGLYKQGASWKRFVMGHVRVQMKARNLEHPPTEEDYLVHGASQLLQLSRSDIEVTDDLSAFMNTYGQS